MGIKRIKAIWLLLKLGFKIKMMPPIEREMYVIAYKLNVDADTTMSTEEKEAVYKFLDQLDK